MLRFTQTLPAVLLTVWTSLSTAWAEDAIPLADILKPSGESTATGGGDVNMSMILFNTLLVLGVGIWVMRQVWFIEWAERVKVAHLENGQPILVAIWHAFPFSWGGVLRPQAREGKRLSPKSSLTLEASTPSWLQRIDVQTLETGTKLHWLRVHGQDYILTETAQHSQWMKLGDPAEDMDAIPSVEGMAPMAIPEASSVYQLRDYLDTI